jgi:hypothetical protein
MLTVVLALLLNVLSGDDSTEWLLVRGKSELPKPLTYKGIAGSHLKFWEWRIVESRPRTKALRQVVWLLALRRTILLSSPWPGNWGFKFVRRRSNFAGTDCRLVLVWFC